MRIVLTNDDGFGSIGIEAAREALSELGEVYVFAPSAPQSGKSCGFTTYYQPLTVHKLNSHDFKVEGTPVDCVLFANAYFQGEYDMIVSGCNNGYNMSNDVMYSGTCGACKQGLVFRKKCIALSAEHFDDDRHIARHIPQALRYLSDGLLCGDYYMNVNFCPSETPYKGFRLTKLHTRLMSKYTLSELGDERYIVKHIHDDDIFDNDDYDVSAVHNGYTSITPISLQGFREEIWTKLTKS